MKFVFAAQKAGPDLTQISVHSISTGGEHASFAGNIRTSTF